MRQRILGTAAAYLAAGTIVMAATLAVAVPSSFAQGRGGGPGGGMPAAPHAIPAPGRGAINGNGPHAFDRDKGLARAGDRRHSAIKAKRPTPARLNNKMRHAKPPLSPPAPDRGPLPTL